MDTIPIQTIVWIIGLFVVFALGFMTGFKP